MAARFPVLSAVGTPGTVGRLSKCCRTFRTIFLDEEIWKALCEEVVGKDIRLKDATTSWRGFYGSWCLSARAWFRAYAKLAREIVERPSFRMRVEFGGEGLPEEWAEAEDLRLCDLHVTDFGVSGTASLFWSDTDGAASLPHWTYGRSRRISKIRVLGGDAAASSQFAFLEVDSGDPRVGALDFARTELVEFAGLSINHSCYCEGGDEDSGGIGEDMQIDVCVAMERVLAVVFGAEEAKAAAAEYLGRSPRRLDASTDLMLFAEVACDRDGNDNLTASLASTWPSPTWYNPEHAYHFRRSYGPVFDRWRRGEELPMPGYKFSFHFDQPAATTQRWTSNLTSLWCLDANGNTSFGRHRARCFLGKKFKCGFLKEPSAAVTRTSDCDFMLCEVQASRDSPAPAGGFDVVVAELATLNVLTMPTLDIRGLADRSRLLHCVELDYAKRLLHRIAMHKVASGADASSVDEMMTDYLQPGSPEGMLRKLVSSNAPDFDLISEQSDQEEERSFWKDHGAHQQQRRIEEIQAARLFDPGEVWTTSFDDETKTFGPGERRVLTEADRPKVGRSSEARSVWYRMGPLRRCQRCRCILTGLQDFFSEEYAIYRERCHRCA